MHLAGIFVSCGRRVKYKGRKKGGGNEKDGSWYNREMWGMMGWWE
jgi:hypothetical protein